MITYKKERFTFMHSVSHNFISLYLAICWVIIKISSHPPWNHINCKKKIKIKKIQNGRHKKTEIFNFINSQYFFMKISWIGPSKKRTKLTILSTFSTQDSEFRSFFRRIQDATICFRNLLTFR